MCLSLVRIQPSGPKNKGENNMANKLFCDRCDNLIEDAESMRGCISVYGNKNTDCSIHFDMCEKCIDEIKKILFPNKNLK